ncbi:STAS domain-containing protein [Paenibacillus chartarius]|uniref:STAS domain-containing protein n=1 Tax=Paenibacillus chartarius TaxID=747481 RepID=A0ABV6DG40_9BACL
MLKCPEFIHILTWKQDVTLKNVEAFRQVIGQLQDRTEEAIVLDLEHVTYLNSAALGAIAEGVLSAKRKGKELVIGGIQPSVGEIFRIVKFETFMRLFLTIEDAVAYLASKAE